MKSTLLFLLFIINLVSDVSAQTPIARVRVFIRDTTRRAIFEHNPNLKHFIVSYDKGMAATVQAIGKDSSAKGKYSMVFEGDRYALSKKYPGLEIPAEPKSEIASLAQVKNIADSSVHVEVTTYIQPDTLYHHFSYYLLSKGIYSYNSMSPFTPPKLQEDQEVFRKRLTLAYLRWKPVAVVDSALVIKGMVELDGSIHGLRLIIGQASPFSDRVLDFISNEAKPWVPMKVIRTKSVKGETRIFVRLNKDDTVTFSTL